MLRGSKAHSYRRLRIQSFYLIPKVALATRHVTCLSSGLTTLMLTMYLPCSSKRHPRGKGGCVNLVWCSQSLNRQGEQKQSDVRKGLLTGGISLGSSTEWYSDCSPASRGQFLLIVADSVQKSSSFVSSLITPSLKMRRRT